MAQKAQRRSQPEASFSAADGPEASRRRCSQPWPGMAGASSAVTAALRSTGLIGQQRAPVPGVVRDERAAGEHVVEPVADRRVVVEAEHRGLGQRTASSEPYRSAMQPTATTRAPESVAARMASTESFLADSMKPQVFTRTASAPSASSTNRYPPAASRPASSSESTSLRAHPRVTTATVRAGSVGGVTGPS
jgi:hypothetical protein